MDKKRPLVQRILIIFLLLFISQTSDAKSTSGSKFLKSYKKIEKMFEQLGTNKRMTKNIYNNFFNPLKLTFDSTGIIKASIPLLYIL